MNVVQSVRRSHTALDGGQAAKFRLIAILNIRKLGRIIFEWNGDVAPDVRVAHSCERDHQLGIRTMIHFDLYAGCLQELPRRAHAPRIRTSADIERPF
jgi:hypothetical protein